MRWNRRYLLKSYISDSLWVVSFVALVLYWVVGRILLGIDGWLERTGRIDERTAFFGVSMSGARSVAGGQYTPRIIATTLLRDNAIRFTVGYFVFTLLFAVRVSGKMRDEAVSQFGMFIVGVLGLASIVVFLYLIDYAARFLRPVSIAQRVRESGIKVIQSVYPKSTTGPRFGQSVRRPALPD